MSATTNTYLAPSGEYAVTRDPDSREWYVVLDPIWAHTVCAPRVLGPFPSRRTATDAVELFRQ